MEMSEFQNNINDDNTSGENLYTQRIYRAKVTDNKDPKKCGRVKVFVPVLMNCHVSPDEGIWAYPVSSEGGASNVTSDIDGVDDFGGLIVPPKDSYVYVFFEDYDVNKPRYFGGVILKDSLPTELTQGEEWQDKHMIHKTPTGRMIFMSDDPDDAGIIIRGKDPDKKKRAAVADPRREKSMEIMLIENKNEQYATVKVNEDFYILIDKKNNNMRFQHPSGSYIILDKDITIQSSGKIFLNCNSPEVIKIK